MKDLIRLSRLGIRHIIKANEDAGLGRASTTDAVVSDSPAVPSEEPKHVADQSERGPEDVIQDAISVLEEGLKDVDTDLESEEKHEVEQTVSFMRKSLNGVDIPISVKAVMRDSADRMLMLRDAETQYWDLPGGHVNEGETLERALRREVKEETGMEFGKCNQTDTRMLKLGKEVRPVLFYDAEYIGGMPRCSKEHIGYQWADSPELNRLDLGVFKEILIPGPQSSEIVEAGDPTMRNKEDAGGTGLSSTGDPIVAEEVHTPTAGRGKRRKLKMLGKWRNQSAFVDYVQWS